MCGEASILMIHELSAQDVESSIGISLLKVAAVAFAKASIQHKLDDVSPDNPENGTAPCH
jgi:hypothetical protein